MVHLFTIESKTQSLYVLARKTNGVWAVESINGHESNLFPTMFVNKAKAHVSRKFTAAAETKVNNRMVGHADDDVGLDDAHNLAW